MRTRIIFCGAVLLALTLTTAMPQFGQNAKNEPPDADQARHMMAISLLRSINTLESALRMKNGSYATWNELLTSQEFKEDMAKCITESGMPLAGAHFAKSPEILPGWSLRLNLNQRRQRLRPVVRRHHRQSVRLRGRNGRAGVNPSKQKYRLQI
jgi:hypothetical protein